MRLTFHGPAAISVCLPPPQDPGLPLARVPWKDILRQVSGRHGIPTDVILSEARQPKIVAARHEAMFLLNKKKGMAAAAVGRRMNRDHSTVLHGVKKHIARMAAE